MAILKKIAELNAERNWSTYELCKRADVSQGTLYSCIRRNSSPSNYILDKLCAAYGITLFQFYNGLDKNGGLTDEQQRILTKWSVLEDDEKSAVENLIDVFTAHKQQK